MVLPLSCCVLVMSLSTAVFIAKAKPKVKPLLRTFELRRCSIVQVSSIDVANLSWTGQVYIELAVPDGANDHNLAMPGDAFPVDGDGKPTFRPPIRWYAAQLDFNNALTFSMMGEVGVRVEDEDLVVAARFEGSWFSSFMLELYPFDSQQLEVSLAMNTRTTGMVPAHLVVPLRGERTELRLEASGFAPHMLWRMHPNLSAKALCVGQSADRQFPTLNISALVTRRPGFILSNIALPVGLFVPIAYLEFAFPVTDQPNRVMVPITMLLTAAAYKNTVAGIMPQISYLTLIDKYVMCCTALIMLMAIEGALIGMLAREGHVELATLIDVVSRVAVGVSYLLLHGVFARRVARSAHVPPALLRMFSSRTTGRGVQPNLATGKASPGPSNRTLKKAFSAGLVTSSLRHSAGPSDSTDGDVPPNVATHAAPGKAALKRVFSVGCAATAIQRRSATSETTTSPPRRACKSRVGPHEGEEISSSEDASAAHGLPLNASFVGRAVEQGRATWLQPSRAAQALGDFDVDQPEEGLEEEENGSWARVVPGS